MIVMMMKSEAWLMNKPNLVMKKFRERDRQDLTLYIINMILTNNWEYIKEVKDLIHQG